MPSMFPPSNNARSFASRVGALLSHVRASSYYWLSLLRILITFLVVYLFLYQGLRPSSSASGAGASSASGGDASSSSGSSADLGGITSQRDIRKHLMLLTAPPKPSNNHDWPSSYSYGTSALLMEKTKLKVKKTEVSPLGLLEDVLKHKILNLAWKPALCGNHVCEEGETPAWTYQDNVHGCEADCGIGVLQFVLCVRFSRFPCGMDTDSN